MFSFLKSLLTPSSKRRPVRCGAKLRFEPLERRELFALDVASLTGLSAAADNNVFGKDITQDAAGDTYLAGRASGN